MVPPTPQTIPPDRRKEDPSQEPPSPEPPASPAQEGPKAGCSHNCQASPSTRPITGMGWFKEKTPENKHVHYPMRPGNYVRPLKSSNLVFEAIADAIEGAERTVDIVSMGFESDLRLKRPDAKRANRILAYKRAYPSEPLDPCDGERAGENSCVLSDLLTRVARKKNIKVRLLIGEPRLIGNTFYDPLHFWYRCKRWGGENGPYANITFALRSFKGKYAAPPPSPETPPPDYTLLELLAAIANRGLDDLGRLARLGWYKDLHTHHQKLVLIDAELAKATAFVIGSNFNEEYWDDDQHSAKNHLRYPYSPWRDAGVMVQGPVVHDIARNIKENWDLMIASKAEVWPEELIADGLAAERSGLLEEEDIPRPRQGSREPFDIRRYQRILSFSPLLLAAMKWPVGHPVQSLAVCGGLATLVDMLSGLLDGTLNFQRPQLGKAKEWGGTIRNCNEYEVDPENVHELSSAQFTRTFCLEGMEGEPDFSVVNGLYHAVSKAGANELIYIENQYFRDTGLVGYLNSVKNSFSSAQTSNASSPGMSLNNLFLIIITSDPSQKLSEGVLSMGPTFMTYKQLEATGVKFHFCKLRTKEHDPCKNGNKYKEPRFGGTMETLLKTGFTFFRNLLQFSPLLLVLLRARFRNLRDLLWGALPLLLKAGAGELGAYSGATMRQAQADVDKVLKEAKELASLLNEPDSRFADYARRLRDNPQDKDALWAEINALYSGHDPAAPRTPLNDPNEGMKAKMDEKTREAILAELKKHLKKTPEDIAVPETGKDKGNIYVHTKAITVDREFAMIGSANHNERSMWHDTEDMLAVQASERHSVPADLRRQLMNTVLAGQMIESEDAKKIFLCFTRHLKSNVDAYLLGMTQQSFVFPYIPGTAVGCAPIS